MEFSDLCKQHNTSYFINIFIFFEISIIDRDTMLKTFFSDNKMRIV